MSDRGARSSSGAFRDALEEGEISADSHAVLVERISDGVQRVGEVLVPPGVFKDEDILLVGVLVDDSSSIAFEAGQLSADRPNAVISGHNRLIAAAQRRATTTRVLFHTSYFATGPLSPYRLAAEAIQLSPENYHPDITRTPLYEQSVVMLGSAIAQARLLADQGCRVRTFTLILTDGEDNVGRLTAGDVHFIVTDMLEFATNHIVAGMGIGPRPFFEQIFHTMGIRRVYAADDNVALDEAFDEIDKLLEIAGSSEEAFKQLTSGEP